MDLINKVKSKINAFRWYLNNQQAGYTAKAVKHEIPKWQVIIEGVENNGNRK